MILNCSSKIRDPPLNGFCKLEVSWLSIIIKWRWTWQVKWQNNLWFSCLLRRRILILQCGYELNFIAKLETWRVRVTANTINIISFIRCRLSFIVKNFSINQIGSLKNLSYLSAYVDKVLKVLFHFHLLRSSLWTGPYILMHIKLLEIDLKTVSKWMSL